MGGNGIVMFDNGGLGRSVGPVNRPAATAAAARQVGNSTRILRRRHSVGDWAAAGRLFLLLML